MTYDCISDCLGRDSIPTPCSAGDGGIARVSDGEIDGFVAQMCRSLRYYICGRYGGCGCVRGEGDRKIAMCAAHVLLAFRCVGWHGGVDGWLYEWRENYWVPRGLHLFTSLFASCWYYSVLQGRASMLLQGNIHQLWPPQVFPGQLSGICPLSRLWPTLGYLHRWPCPLHLQREAHLPLDD